METLDYCTYQSVFFDTPDLFFSAFFDFHMMASVATKKTTFTCRVMKHFTTHMHKITTNILLLLIALVPQMPISLLMMLVANSCNKVISSFKMPHHASWHIRNCMSTAVFYAIVAVTNSY